MRLRQRFILLLQLREQAHILDGDYRLVRKDLEQLDVTVGEGLDAWMGEADDADNLILADHRHRENASRATGSKARSHLRAQLKYRRGLDVARADDASCPNGFTGEIGAAREWSWPRLAPLL